MIMKKILLPISLVCLMISSCAKEYTCTCTSTFDDGSTSVKTEDYFNISKDQAETNCQVKSMDIANSYSVLGYNTKVHWAVTIK